MANPTIVASGKFKTTGAESSLSCPIPTIAAGKLIVLLGYSVSSAQSLNTPSGYTARFGANASEGYIGCWTKVSTGGDDTATLATSGGGSYRLQAQYLVIEGYDAATPVNVSALDAASAGSNWNSPSVTPTVNEGLLIGMGGATGVSDWQSGDEPDTMTLIDQESTDGSWFGTAYENLSSSSSGVATGTRLWTNAVNSKRTASMVIAPSTATAAPVISDGTPTGTTTATPTLGFTTDTNSGTARFVVDSAANLTGVTAAQVLAGQKASGAAAAYDTGEITVDSTSIAGTLAAVLPLGEYTAAAAQNDGEDDSNVLTWTFTVGPYMAADESGDDVFAADGAAGLNGISETLRDTDTGAVLAEESGLIVTVRAASDSEATLYATTAGETDAGGVLQFSSTAIGDPGDYVYLSVEKSDNSRVAMFRVQVKDLNSL